MKKIILISIAFITLFAIGCDDYHVAISSETGTVINNCGSFSIDNSDSNLRFGKAGPSACTDAKTILSFDTSELGLTDVIQRAALAFRLERLNLGEEINEAYIENNLRIDFTDNTGFGAGFPLDINDYFLGSCGAIVNPTLKV